MGAVFISGAGCFAGAGRSCSSLRAEHETWRNAQLCLYGNIQVFISLHAFAIACVPAVTVARLQVFGDATAETMFKCANAIAPYPWAASPRHPAFDGSDIKSLLLDCLRRDPGERASASQARFCASFVGSLACCAALAWSQRWASFSYCNFIFILQFHFHTAISSARVRGTVLTRGCVQVYNRIQRVGNFSTVQKLGPWQVTNGENGPIHDPRAM